MNVITVADYDEMSDRAAAIVIGALKEMPNLVLGLATGSSPEGLYQRLVEAHRNDGLDLSELVTFNLDEYVGLAPDHEQSYRRFMDDRLFNHINAKPENTHVPDGLAPDPEAYCADYERAIARAGGIDLQVLGIGGNGHIAFNEPGTPLDSRTHVTELSEETIQDNSRLFDSPDEVPRSALTMGVGTVLEARKCLLLASGANKADAVRAFIEGPVTPAVTASALQGHPDVTVIVDLAGASKLERAEPR